MDKKHFKKENKESSARKLIEHACSIVLTVHFWDFSGPDMDCSSWIKEDEQD